jgi:hypothetical protein
MFIFPLKVLKLTNRGSQDFPALWPFAEGLFYFKIFYEKRRIFNIKSRIIIKIVNVFFYFKKVKNVPCYTIEKMPKALKEKAMEK